ncbi:MAG: ATP-binding protein [Nitrospiraceae bacterium]|nr:ATP-binding protein [Nitrospiraceae bacterium]
MIIWAITAVSLIFVYLSVRGLLLYRRFSELDEFVEDLARGGLDRRYYLRGKSGFSKVLYNLSIFAANVQEQTRENEACNNRLQVLLKNIPDGIILMDAKGRVRSLNPAFEDLLHLRGNSIAGKGLAESLNIAGMGELLARAREENSGKKETLAYDSKFIEITAMPFSDPVKKEYAGQVVVFRDVTADKRIDEIRKDFVANVSHELKTPVTAIMGYVDTLLDGAMENREDLSRFLKVISFQVGRMDQLIKDLIELSRIEFGAVAVEKRPVQLNEMAGKVISLYEEQAKAKGIYVRSDISDECSTIQADPGILSHILSNLLDNAVKYTETGGVVLRAREGDNYSCVLVVQDTGIGVPKKFVPRLGERFFRVDPSRSREMGGTGLGLAIVKHLVITMGWRMHIDSDPGRGTSVRIYIN